MKSVTFYINSIFQYKQQVLNLSSYIDTIKNSFRESLMIFKNPNTLLFIPIYFFIGSWSSFLTYDVSVNYMSCEYGINILGVFFLIIAVSSIISSALTTQIAKILNKTIMISLIIFLLIVVLFYLSFWTQGTSVYVMFGLASYFGFFEATWGTFLQGNLPNKNP